MDGSKKVMESFDSLWFFNNVLTLTTFQHKARHPAAVAALDEEDNTVEKQEHSEDRILRGVPNVAAPGTEILVPRCPKCGEIAVGIERRMVHQPVKEVEFAKPTERRRRKRGKRSKRKVLGELDLEFCGNLASESSFSEETYGYQNFESSQHYTKMPPLNDGLAMKEHLKSWAYAVACTVR